MPSRKLLSRPIRQRLHRAPGWFSRVKLVCWRWLNSFRRPHLCAARPRIEIDLFLSGGHGLFRQQFVVTLLHAFAQGIFYDAVLQRVETDDHYSSARLQHPRGRVQQCPQVVQFMVYEDSECLESSRRGMNSSFGRVHWPGRGRNHGCELRSRVDGPRPDNGSGDSPRPPFLTEFVNQVRECDLVNLIYHLFGGGPGLRIHSHVERSFRLKAKAPRWRVQLEAAYAEVCQQSVGRRRLEPLSYLRAGTMQQTHFRPTLPPGRNQPDAGLIQRRGIFIEPNQ